MAINLKSTKDWILNFLNMLVYGVAGGGKTTLITTLPNPIILSAEGGLLSIAEHDIPFIEVTSMDDLREAYKWLLDSEEAKQFESVALDSISEIGEVCLSREKSIARDPRQAYGEMQTTMSELIRSFRDLPKHVLMTAKLEKAQDEMGRMLYSPSMPGNKLGQSLPYFFDLVLALRVEKDEQSVHRGLMTASDGLWEAKDRSGKLDPWMAPDLGLILKKLGGNK